MCFSNWKRELCYDKTSTTELEVFIHRDKQYEFRQWSSICPNSHYGMYIIFMIIMIQKCIFCICFIIYTYISKYIVTWFVQSEWNNMDKCYDVRNSGKRNCAGEEWLPQIELGKSWTIISGTEMLMRNRIYPLTCARMHRVTRVNWCKEYIVIVSCKVNSSSEGYPSPCIGSFMYINFM